MKRATISALFMCACAARGPIPTGDKPAWVSTPNGDLRFPADRFVAQVGTTAVGMKPAPELLASVDAAARDAVVETLKRAVRAEATAYESAPAQVEQRAGQMLAELGLGPSIAIEGRWRAGDTAYAWAVFDKSKALAAQQEKAAAREKAAADLMSQAAAAEGEKPADALRDYARAHGESAAAVSSVLLVRALGGKMEPGGVMPEAERKVSALLGELTVSVVEGDQQRAAEGKPLPQPIVFTAWLKGKRAAGLPMAAAIAGGRAAPVAVGADGKAELRVDDVGKFAAGSSEQQIQIAIDWPALLGVGPDRVPAWIAAQPRAGIAATALKKGVGTTRVLVLIVAGQPSGEALTAALQAQGFPAENGQALIEKFGAARIAKMSDAQLREAAKRVAEVVAIGGGKTVRAIDVGTGATLYKGAAGGTVAAELGAALKKAAEE